MDDSEIDAQRSHDERMQDAKDAERYRWLVTNCHLHEAPENFGRYTYSKKWLDGRIDECRAAHARGEVGRSSDALRAAMADEPAFARVADGVAPYLLKTYEKEYALAVERRAPFVEVALGNFPSFLRALRVAAGVSSQVLSPDASWTTTGKNCPAGPTAGPCQDPECWNLGEKPCKRWNAGERHVTWTCARGHINVGGLECSTCSHPYGQIPPVDDAPKMDEPGCAHCVSLLSGCPTPTRCRELLASASKEAR